MQPLQGDFELFQHFHSHFLSQITSSKAALGFICEVTAVLSSPILRTPVMENSVCRLPTFLAVTLLLNAPITKTYTHW